MKENELYYEIVRNGYGKTDFASAIGIQPATFRNRVKHESLTVEDIKNIRLKLHLSDEQTINIFFD